MGPPWAAVAPAILAWVSFRLPTTVILHSYKLLIHNPLSKKLVIMRGDTIQAENRHNSGPLGGQFGLANSGAYRRWRDAKLGNYPHQAGELVVEIDDIAAPTQVERAAIIDRVRRANMAIYQCRRTYSSDQALRFALASFAGTFGLRRDERPPSSGPDGIVALEVASNGRRSGYIPFTDRAINWHTDGYYNRADDQVQAMVLHCVRDAARGGENALFDPEIAYIRLRDKDPAMIEALTRDDALTVPENYDDAAVQRPASTGPVFSFDAATGTLHMRYTARARYAIWRDDPATLAAKEFLEVALAGAEPLLLRHRLTPGEGVIGNNVLHTRTRFVDGPKNRRLLYRLRFKDRIRAAEPR